MTIFASAATHFLVRAVSAVGDTVWVQRPIGPFETVTSIAIMVITLALMVIAIAVVPAVLHFRTIYTKTTAMLDKLQADIAPLLIHARSIADNVDYVSTSIREDVGTLHGTLVEANLRMREAVAMTEHRLHDFSALLSVAQQEAEGIFVSTAAAVHGVRTGASHFSGADGRESTSDEGDDDDLETDTDGGELDGDDRADEPNATRAPRIIRRTRTRR